MKKNVVLTVAMTMVAVLICVGFGFHLGAKQAANVDYLKNPALDAAWSSDYPVGVGTNSPEDAPKEPFVTAGELIEETDDFGWLLLPAVSLSLDGIAVKAALSTNTEWKTATSYQATLQLPDEVFIDGSDCNADVYYPTSLKAGETGTVIVIVSSDNGYAYCGYCQFTAADNLQIVYGSSHPQTASGGEFDTSLDGCRLDVNFYTAATPEHRSNRDGSAGHYGAWGDMTIEFIDITDTTDPRVSLLDNI